MTSPSQPDTALGERVGLSLMQSWTPSPEAVTAFIVEATEQLDWMDRELAELKESDRLGLAAARKELVQMLKSVADEWGGCS